MIIITFAADFEVMNLNALRRFVAIRLDKYTIDNLQDFT
jgi:hypothetical protein